MNIFRIKRELEMKIIITMLYLIIIGVLLSSCAMKYDGMYVILLNDIEINGVKSVYSAVKINEEKVNKYTYQDENIDFVWHLMNDGIAFSLFNKSGSSLKIHWDDVLIINESGIALSVIHKGIKYINKNNHQPPTTVINNSKIDEFIVPKIKIFSYSDGSWGVYKLIEGGEEAIGRNIKVYLPVEKNSQIIEYIFNFHIQDIQWFNKKS